MPKNKNIKKLIVFDFDDTLFNTPYPEEGQKIWKKVKKTELSSRDWWRNPKTLDFEVFDIKPNKSIYNAYKNAISDPDNYVIMATGRVEKLRPQVQKILNKYNINFDETHLKPEGDTYVFKKNLFDSLINKLKPEEFIMYDDRKEHLVKFKKWAEKLPIKTTIVDSKTNEKTINNPKKTIKESIRQILKEESLKQDLKDEIKQYGWKETASLVGGDDILADIAFNNDPMEFLNMYNDLDVAQSNNYSNRILFRYEPRHNLMSYNRKTKAVYISYYEIWSFLEKGFGLNYTEIKELTQRWLDEVYNLSGVTTHFYNSIQNTTWMKYTI